MKNICLLIILFNCTKLNIKNIKNLNKNPISSSLIKAIENADNIKIESEIENIKNNNNGNLNLIDLGDDGKNFLMVLLENYGVNYEPEENMPEIDINTEKVNIFKKYLKDFEHIIEDRINDCDSNGKTLLFYAIDTGIEEIVKALLDIPNIDAEHLDNDSISPLNYSISNREDIFKYLERTLIEGTSQNYLTKFKLSSNKKLAGTPPLIHAISHKKQEIVKLLLKNGAESNVENDKNVKAVCLAAYHQNEKIVEALLAKGAKHLSKRGLILSQGKTVMLILTKIFGPKLIEAAPSIAEKITGSKISPIAVNLELEPIIKYLERKHSGAVDKKACYKEIRRIYKKGGWVTHFNKNEIDKKLAIEVALLLPDILNKINKKSEYIAKLEKKYLKARQIEKLQKIFAISKLGEGDLPKSKNGIKGFKTYLNTLKSRIKKLEKVKNKVLTPLLEDLKNEIDPNKIVIPKINPYDFLNNLKDNTLKEYFKDQGNIVSFHQLDNLYKKVIEDFKELIGGDDAYKYLYNYSQKRKGTFSKPFVSSKKLLSKFKIRRSAFEKFKESYKELLNQRDFLFDYIDRNFK